MQNYKILCVDDEPSILSALKRVLVEESYTVRLCDTAKEAMEIISNDPIDLLIADQRMPDVSGLELLRWAKEHSPMTIRIMLTGQADLDEIVLAINEGEIFRFIAKPWENNELKITVRQALQYHEVLQENENVHKVMRRRTMELQQENQQLKEELDRLRSDYIEGDFSSDH